MLVPLLAATLLAGCGGSSMVSGGDPVPSPYDGPMSLLMHGDEEAPVADRAGAAAEALECDGDAYAGGGADYSGGLESVQDNATKALENLFAEEGLSATLPDTGYRIEREDDDRVLFSYDVDKRTKIAFIAHDGINDYNHDQGWGIESWAQCDPAELPDDVTDGLNIGVWTDASGKRVPESTVTSYEGAEHCDWEDITFVMHLEETQYVRDVRGELKDSLLTTYDRSADLPEDATDTGLRHDGRQLWVVPAKDAAYLVSIDDASDVERWPAAKDRIGCA